MIAYRIARARFAHAIWSGSGARNHGGRWNSKGVAVAYAAESRALAALEQLVHLIPPRILRGFVISSIEFDDRQVHRINMKTLPSGWDRAVPPAALRKYGDAWVARGPSLVLAAPSAIIRGEWNYLVNPSHRDFDSAIKSKAIPFVYDQRLR